MDWNNIITLAGVFAGAALAAYVGYFRKSPEQSPTKHLEIAGALVDSSSIKQLAAAIVTYNEGAAERRVEAEKNRQIGYRMLEVGSRLVDEVRELRNEIGDLAKEIARAK